MTAQTSRVAMDPHQSWETVRVQDMGDRLRKINKDGWRVVAVVPMPNSPYLGLLCDPPATARTEES